VCGTRNEGFPVNRTLKCAAPVMSFPVPSLLNISLNIRMNSQQLDKLATRIIDYDYTPACDELVELLEFSRAHLIDVIARSHRITRAKLNAPYHLCGIVNAKSGLCSEDCAFCAQSARHNTGIETFDFIDSERMADATRRAIASGATGLGIVTSGHEHSFEEFLPQIERLVDASRAAGTIELHASIGMLSVDDCLKLKELGITRINHNLETSRRHFPNIVTTHTWDERVRTVRNAKEAGLEICCGGIFGLGETDEDIAELALTINELDIDAIPLNFVIPIKGTRIESTDLTPARCLSIISLFRFANPTGTIRPAGGREHHLRGFQSWALPAGANSFIVGDYLTQKGRPPEEDVQMLADWESFIRS
jgi:biotin synthase